MARPFELRFVLIALAATASFGPAETCAQSAVTGLIGVARVADERAAATIALALDFATLPRVGLSASVFLRPLAVDAGLYYAVRNDSTARLLFGVQAALFGSGEAPVPGVGARVAYTTAGSAARLHFEARHYYRTSGDSDMLTMLMVGICFLW